MKHCVILRGSQRIEAFLCSTLVSRSTLSLGRGFVMACEIGYIRGAAQFLSRENWYFSSPSPNVLLKISEGLPSSTFTQLH